MPELSHEYFMREALKEANTAYYKDEVPIGAIIVLNNKIIARAHNLVELLNDITAHAEILAITSASNYLGSKYLHDCFMYVTMEPCVMCTGALYWSQISKLIISTKDEKRGAISNGINLHPKTEIIYDVLKYESEKLIKTFFDKKRFKQI